ncbi:hypothetical protein ACFFGH_18515 [Lysobacter korlensis]|uniref:Transmembrane protein n=1 Tax=Lysobacter korlensis TaxID=553636 RepID=A0ABV6RS87_9GAMM
MSATLIAVVVSLALARLAPALAVSLRRYGWYGAWLGWLASRLGPSGLWRGAPGFAIGWLTPVLAIALVQLAVDDAAFGLPGLLLGIAALFYTWGPRDLDDDVEAVAGARDSRTRREAAARLWPRGVAPVLGGGPLIEAVFRNGLRRWFGVLFWFLLLGPAGALGYRLAALSAEGEASERFASDARGMARRCLAWLDWPAAQLMTLSLGLVGNFDAVLGAWRAAGGASLRPERDFLGAAARASVRCELAEEAADAAEDYIRENGGTMPPPITLATPDVPELRDAMSLLWRCLLVWLAVMALFVIAGWVS